MNSFLVNEEINNPNFYIATFTSSTAFYIQNSSMSKTCEYKILVAFQNNQTTEATLKVIHVIHVNYLDNFAKSGIKNIYTD